MNNKEKFFNLASIEIKRIAKCYMEWDFGFYGILMVGCMIGFMHGATMGTWKEDPSFFLIIWRCIYNIVFLISLLSLFLYITYELRNGWRWLYQWAENYKYESPKSSKDN